MEPLTFRYDHIGNSPRCILCLLNSAIPPPSELGLNCIGKIFSAVKVTLAEVVANSSPSPDLLCSSVSRLVHIPNAYQVSSY